MGGDRNEMTCLVAGPLRHPTEEEIRQRAEHLPPDYAEIFDLSTMMIAKVCWLDAGHDGPHDWELAESTIGEDSGN